MMVAARELLQNNIWLAYLPLLNCGLVIVTYVFCICFAVASNTFIGNIPIPYFSDTGREKPAYYVFAISLTLASILLVGIYYLMYSVVLKPTISLLKERKEGKKESCGCCCSYSCEMYASLLFGIISTPFLAILSIFETAFHETLHIIAAYAFFSLQVISMGFSIHLFHLLKNEVIRQQQSSVPTSDDNADTIPDASINTTTNFSESDVAYWQRTVRIKTIVAIVFLIAFIIYIPIGVSIGCDELRLTTEDCKETYNLGDVYCDDRFYKVTEGSDGKNISLTVLLDYSQKIDVGYSQKCVDIHTMRTVSQFFSIATLVLYMGTFTIDFGHVSKKKSSSNSEEKNLQTEEKNIEEEEIEA